MRQDKKLMLGMTILFLITFVIFGTIVTTEKLAPFFTDRIKTKFETYLKENYKTETKNLKIGKITYKNQVYEAKVTNKENKNLYFSIYYQNKKITDTYTKDYKQGKTLITSLEKELEKEIKNEINKNVTITFPLTLNKYSKTLQQRLIKNDNIKSSNLYNISFNIKAKLIPEEITNKIIEMDTKLKEKNILPNEYSITINNNEDNTKLKINNLTQNTLEITSLYQIISDIINNNESDIIKINNITYQYTKGENKS